MNIYLWILAVLPVIVLAIVVYRQDRINKEPFGKLLKAFIFGVLSIIPAAMMENLLQFFTPPIPVLSGVYTGFVVAGCSEELWKLVFLSLAIWRSKEFNEYFDGIVYAAFTSLGFACFENISYILGQGTFLEALTTGSVRAVLSVPGHFLFGVAMGYYFSLAKFNPEHRFRHLLMAFAVPMLLHGTFDALLMIPESLGANTGLIGSFLFIVLIWFDIRLWKWGIQRIKHLQELSRRQDADRNHPFKGFTWDF